MPATGTPEPGGLLWDETLNISELPLKIQILLVQILMNLHQSKVLILTIFLVGKLAYKILSYKYLY